MAALPDIPGQIRERKRLVLGLGAESLIIVSPARGSGRGDLDDAY